MTSNYDREIPAKGNRGGSGSAGLNGASRSSGARGRIASVLAQARASLKEPSRPYTPNSLDQRTALDSAFDNGFNNYNSNSNSNSKNGSRSVANSRVADAKQYDKVFQFLNNKKSLAGDTSESSSSGKERKIAQLLSQSQPLSNFSNCEDSNLDSDVSLSLNYNSEYSTFQLIIRDTEDIINILDYEIIGFVNSYSTDRIQDALDSLADPLSRINQRLRTDSKMSEYDKTEVESLGMNMCQVMMRMNDQRIKSSLKFCMCRYVLRLYLSIVAAEKDNILTPSVTGALSRTTQFMYKVKGLNNNDLNKVNSSGIGSLQNSEESMIVTNGIDLLLDLLSQIWKRFNSDLEKSILLCSDTPQMSDDGFDAQPFAEYLKSTNQDSAATSAQISNNGKSSSSQFKDSRFLELMDSGAYAAAVIRSYSTQETDRKRLVHSGTVEIMSDGMKMIESNKTVQQIAASKTASKYTDAVVGKISQLLVQLVGAIRNFAIDSTGRAQLLSHRMVVRLCNAQRIFKKHPDLLLNCARVTAKLSLQDNFRAQINSKPNNIKCLAEVIVTEGILCNRVMEGDLGEEEELEWPSWHTWPLLSRVCFTLGNLTTTNEANRKLIGIDCKVLKPITLLLQACAGSLTRLYNNANMKEEGESEGDSSEGSINEENLNQETNSNKSGGQFASGMSEKSSNPSSRNLSRQSSSKYQESAQDIDSSFEGEGEQENLEEEDDSAELELTDATIKLLRLLANLSIDQTIGSALASKNEILSILLDLVICTNSSVKKTEELLLNAIAACTNITFYACQHLASYPADIKGMRESSSDISLAEVKQAYRMEQSLVGLSLHLSQCLFHENDEIVLETARVLGNLSRRKAVLLSLLMNRTDEALVLLLSSVNSDTVAAVTGVLINMSADSRGRVALLTSSDHLLASLANILRKVSFRDIQLCTLICQVLHNLLASESASGSITVPVILCDTLMELLDCAMDLIEEENSFDSHSNNDIVIDSFEKAKSTATVLAYSNFVTVAKAVLPIMNVENR